MREYSLKNKDNIKLANVLFAVTSEPDYEMGRLLLLENMPETKYGEFVLVEGWHCSCYNFDETNWDCIVVTLEELKKILGQGKVFGLRNELKKYLERYMNE